MALDRTLFNLWVNDDGSNTVGTLINKTRIDDDILDPIDDEIARIDADIAAAGGYTTAEQTTSSSGTVNDFALTSASSVLLRCTNSSLMTLTGFAGGVAGKRVTVICDGSANVALAHEGGTSTGANRLLNPVTSANMTLAAGKGYASFEYDDTTDRWRMVSFEQGNFISQPFSAGDFTASGSMTWTVAAGDVSHYRYYLQGRMLYIDIRIVTSSVGGSVATILKFAVPGGYTVSSPSYGQAWADDNGTKASCIFAPGRTTATIVDVEKNDSGGSNWTLSTNNTEIRGQIAAMVT